MRLLPRTTLLIGIDDTDNLESRGTGQQVQRLLAMLEVEGLGEAVGATRHQLLVDSRIPYTSHNSSACIAWDGGARPHVKAIIEFCQAFLESECAPGSDPGLVVASPAVMSEPTRAAALMAWGQRAKREVVTLEAARALAAELGVHASGHGGTHGGIIGALAAVGLHLTGGDGLFLWMPGLRSLQGPIVYSELRERVAIAAACGPDGVEPGPDDMIELGEWVRPILRDGQAVLLLDGLQANGQGEGHGHGNGTGNGSGHGRQRWDIAPKEFVKRYCTEVVS